MENDERESLGKLGAWLGVGGNFLLTTIKLAAGIWGGSQGLVAEAIHSSADLISSFGVLFGIRIANRPADEDHPYGHGKAEFIAALAVSAILILTGLELAYSGIKGVIKGVTFVPEPVTLFVAIFTIVYNEVLFRYRLSIGKKINSPAIISDAWHQRADVFACIAVTVGIIGARLGFPILDPAAAAIVSLFVIHTGWTLIKDAVNQLMDKSAGKEVDKTINFILQSFTAIEEIEMIRTRNMGNGILIDLKIKVTSGLSVQEAHALALNVKVTILKQIPNAKDVSIHYGPTVETNSGRVL